MKKHLVLFPLLALILSSCKTQNISADKIPSVVLNTFNSRYSAASDVDWKKINDFYEAELDINDSTEVTVRIDETGKLDMQKKDVSIHELPAEIVSAIQRGYKEYLIDDTEQIEKDGSVYYQVELNGKGNKDLHLVYNRNGIEEKYFSYWD